MLHYKPFLHLPLEKHRHDKFIVIALCASHGLSNDPVNKDCCFFQYDKDLIEVWDEAKRLRCEWYNDYEKGVTKPPIRVSDIEVVELNFRGNKLNQIRLYHHESISKCNCPIDGGQLHPFRSKSIQQ